MMDKQYKLTLEFSLELIVSFITLFIGLFYFEWRLLFISLFGLVFAMLRPITELAIKMLGDKD